MRFNCINAFLISASIFVSCGSFNAVAQTPVKVMLGHGAGCGAPATEAYIYDTLDNPPSFPGGEAAMIRFINSERCYPRTAYDANIEGRVLCSVVVEPDGKLTNIDVVKGVEESLNREAVRVIGQMPQWQPGSVNGRKVRVYCLIPIPFRL